MEQTHPGIPGYNFIDPQTLQDPTVEDWTQQQWELEFGGRRNRACPEQVRFC